MTITAEPAATRGVPPPGAAAFAPPPGAPPFDPARAEAFGRRVVGDMAGAVTSILCSLGDRLGLFRALASGGPAAPAELAARASIHERYAREWLSALAVAGYLEHDPGSGRFALPPEHAPVLASEGNPFFMGGAFQQMPALFAPVERLAEAFRTGGGVPQAVYGPELRAGMERMSAAWFDTMLVQQWIPSVPAVHAALQRGARVADVGCGSGRALVRMAQAFPNSRFDGFDAFGPVLERAQARAAEEGVAGRVRFERRSVLNGLPGSYDLVTAFDSLHDVTDVPAGLRSIRRALSPGGALLVLEMSCHERLEDDAGPVGTILYATSVLYNVPVARADGGEGVGTMGLSEPRLRALCESAGFRSFRRVPIANPFNALYLAEP